MPCKAPLKIGLIMTNEKARSLELFYRPTCPFCQKVLRWMENHNVDNVTLFDITSDSAAEQRLAEVGGKKQVPCLPMKSCSASWVLQAITSSILP